MAFPNLQRGTSFRILAGDGATPTEAFTLICVATTKKFTRSIDTEDHKEIDCANPGNLPVRISVPTGQSWDLEISGRADFAKYLTLETWLDGNDHNIQITREGTGVQGGGKHSGAVKLVKLDLGTNDNNTVTFSAAFKGQFALPAWVANA
jgi:hypothetical protein